MAVAAEAGLKSPVEFIPEGVSVTVRESEDTEYLFIQNYRTQTTDGCCSGRV